MSHRRYDWLFDRWVIIAQDRDRRPDDFKQKNSAPTSNSARCPFCPGNEHLTPADLLTITQAEIDSDLPGRDTAGNGYTSSPNTNQNWQIRVVPNRFPIVVPSWKAFELGIASELDSLDSTQPSAESGKSDSPSAHDFFVEKPIVGYHEVIVETPDHDQIFADMSDREVQSIFDAYVIRLNDLDARDEIEHVSIFKNYGSKAGASLQHPHSQLIALNFTPPMLTRAASRASWFYRENDECYFCQQLNAELESEERILAVTDSFAVFCPYASRFSGNIKIIPRSHSSSFRTTTSELRLELAQLLLASLRSLEEVFPGDAFNYMLNEPPKFSVDHAWHWSFELFMRTAQPAGFEWNTDCFVNATNPEKLASRLRPKLARHLAELQRADRSIPKIPN